VKSVVKKLGVLVSWWLPFLQENSSWPQANLRGAN
jgi:hypothetical protein